MKCKSCGKEIIFLRTDKGKAIPVDKDTVKFSIPIVVMPGRADGTLAVKVCLQSVTEKIHAEANYDFAIKQQALPFAFPPVPEGTAVYKLRGGGANG